MWMVNFRCAFIKKTPTNLCISHIHPSIKDIPSRTMFGESLCVMYDITRRKKTLKNSKHSFSYAFATVGSKSIYFSSCLVKSHTHKGMNYLTKKNCSPITANLSLIRKQRGGYSGRENCFFAQSQGDEETIVPPTSHLAAPSTVPVGDKNIMGSREDITEGTKLRSGITSLEGWNSACIHSSLGFSF